LYWELNNLALGWRWWWRIIYGVHNAFAILFADVRAAAQFAHCRIGLARPFLMQENHCYLMLNGLFLY